MALPVVTCLLNPTLAIIDLNILENCQTKNCQAKGNYFTKNLQNSIKVKYIRDFPTTTKSSSKKQTSIKILN
jgi:hypothetical protein